MRCDLAVDEVDDHLAVLLVAFRDIGVAGRKLAAWDVGFHAERLQRSRYSVSQEELRPYFPLPRVLSGLFEVAERLFGVRIRERQGVPVWQPQLPPLFM